MELGVTLGQALALAGILFTLICTLVGYIWRRFERRIDAVEEKAQTGDLAQFKAFDAERERHWMLWRSDMEARLKAHIEGQGNWRHHEYGPEARKQSAAIATLQEQVVSLRERSERLERKVFNGHKQ